MNIGVDQAHRTLCVAAAFLSRLLISAGPEMLRAHPKVTANGLRELDGFLSILLSELAAADGWSKEDLISLARTRNTPNKLEALCLRRKEEARDIGRLRALGRCRDALFHSDGVVCRGDDRHAKTLTLGWPGDGCGDRVARHPAGDQSSRRVRTDTCID